MFRPLVAGLAIEWSQPRLLASETYHKLPSMLTPFSPICAAHR